MKGPKGPFAFNQHVFSNFFKSLKIRTAWRKDFFDTLCFAACGKANDMQLATTRFRAAVLPLDRELETALFHRLDAKRCAVCGTLFIPGSNRAKYCPECAVQVRRCKEAERQRKRYYLSTHLGAEKPL